MHVLCAALPAPAIALTLLSSSGQTQSPQIVRVALFPSDSSAQVYYAQDLGMFRAAGLDVQLVELKDGAARDIIAH